MQSRKENGMPLYMNPNNWTKFWGPLYFFAPLRLCIFAFKIKDKHSSPLFTTAFKILPILLIYLLSGCERQHEKRTLLCEDCITRRENENHFTPYPQKIQNNHAYPWYHPSLTRISKYHFRCRGDVRHPMIKSEKGNENIYLFDCDGLQGHSLPIRDDKEFIYPVLIDILNYLQDKLGSVVITSGHRCPDHNSYVDSSFSNQFSKHMIGAEVDFYVRNMEKTPLKVIDCIQNYFLEHSQNKDDPAFTRFQRYEKDDLPLITKPWFNKEIFIKLYLSNEGRNFDNQHPFPYISIQVRWDSEKNEKVNYSWERAFYGFYRK